MTGPAPPLDPVRHGGAGLRTFLNIAELWKLSRDEQMRMLDVQAAAEFEDWSANVRVHKSIEIPMEAIVRIGCVLSIYASLETLLPGERVAEWLRAPNRASLFGARKALDMMTSEKQLAWMCRYQANGNLQTKCTCRHEAADWLAKGHASPTQTSQSENEPCSASGR